MARTLFLLLLCLCSLPTWAQSDTTRLSGWQRYEQKREAVYAEIDTLRGKVRRRLLRDRRARKIDSLIQAMDEKAKKKYDTLYIRKPPQLWTIKLRTNLSGNELVARGKPEGKEARLALDAAHKLTFTAAVGFRGITLSLAANPAKWAEKNKDFEYNLNSYSNRYGFDVIYTTANTFRGQQSVGELYRDISAGEVRQKLLTVNGYYAFNHRRFSYPAAFTQSQIQLRSAGSWLLSVMYLGGSIRADAGDDPELQPQIALHHHNFGIGGGYGYNWVLPHQWLIHASATPEIVVYNKSDLKINGEKAAQLQESVDAPAADHPNNTTK